MSSAALKDVSKLLSGSMLAKGFGVVSLILFTRLLTKPEMAAFPTFLMIGGLVDLFLQFGIFSQVIMELPSLCRTDIPKARSLVMTSSAIIFGGTVIPSVAAYVFANPIAGFVFRDSTQGWIIALMAPGFLAYCICRIADTIMWGRGQYGSTSILQIVESIVRPVCTIALYFVMGYAGVVIGIVASQFIMAALSFYYVSDLFIGPLPPLYPVRKLIMDSLPYYIGNYLAYLRGDGDVVVITTFLGPSKLTEFYVAKTLYVNVTMILTALDRVSVERLARLVHAPEFADKIKELQVQIARTTIPFVFFVIAVTPYAMTVLAGQRYSGVSWTAIVLLIGALIQFVSIPVNRGVYLIVPAFVRVSYAVVESLAVVITAIALVPLAGLVGVAAARALAFAITTAFGLIMLHKCANLSLPLGSTATAMASSIPGTLLAIFVAPPAHTVIAAFAWSAVVTVGWTTVFLILTYLIDRPAFDSLKASAQQRYRAYFPA